MLDQNKLFSVEVDSEKLNAVIKDEVRAHLKNATELNKIFYTMKDLSYLTGLSQSSIYKYMFLDKRLPKRKVGNKWLFKADLMDTFLDTWIDEFPES